MTQVMILNKRMRAKQVAAENSIHVNTVWNYVKKGNLTPIKVSSGVTVFDRAEVERFFSGTAHEEQ